MSNKTSDKNVANIEEDIKYVKEMLEIARVFFKAVKTETDYKDVDDVAFCNAVEHILAELEQKNKRIKELEEERDHWHGCFIVAMENGIAKEKVINVIQEYKEKIEKYNEYRIQGQETDVEYYENITNTAIVQILQELLEKGGNR